MDSKIIVNPEALSQLYTPEKILHREKELAQLSSCLVNFVNTFVYGSHGSGKSLLTKCAIQDFNTQRGRAIYIDCSLYQTANAILHEVLLSLNSVVSSKSNYDLTKRLKAKMRHLDSKLIICLDHLERIKEIETLNMMLSLGLGLITVSEGHDSYRKLEPRIKANIANLTEIPGYSVDQTFDILMERAKLAFEEYTYSEDTIRKIAEACSGDITLGINLLISLALKAQSEEKKSIDEVEFEYDVNCSYEDLNRDQKVIMKTLEEWGSLPSRRLYDFYTEKIRHPKSRRSFRIYMRELSAKGLVKSIGDKRGRIYELVDQEEIAK